MSEPDEKYNPYEHEPLPEGEESPPPFVHTMAIVRWVILSAITLFALFMVLSYFGATPWSTTQATAIQYHCPMHPTYISNQPGECPICGMTLVPITADSMGTKTAGSIKTDSSTTMPADNMPKAKPGQWTCPMDPQVISDKPGECPICGMDLVQVPQMTVGANEDMSSMPGMTPAPTGYDTSSMGTVPGLVTVTIEPQRLQLTGIRTGKVQRRRLADRLQLAGYVTADETRTSNIHIRTSGWVRNLFVDQTGQYVKAGQPLLTIYSPDLAQAQQDLIVARKATQETIADSELSYMRKQLLDAARQKLRLLGLSEQDVRAAENSDSVGSDLTLRSPVSGYVLEKTVLPGQFVGADQNLFTIADLSTIWVLADVYEQDIAVVKVGQSAELTLTALPGETITGKVAFIYPSVSAKSRALRVRLEFANPSLLLRPGMYADVQLLEDSEPVLALPSDAVMDGGETKYAFVVHDGKHFEPRLLKLGRSDDDWIEVLSGVSEGDEVVTSANFLIDSESKLKAAIAGMGSTGGAGDMGGMDMSDQQKRSQ
jgi:membrane fusion protein, copper/silver efflux system